MFAHSQGRIRDRWHDAQQKRVMALNLVIAAIVYWNTLYMDKATDHLRRQGRLPDPSLLRHVSPLGWDHIVLTGDYDWNSGAAERTNVRPLNLAQTARTCIYGHLEERTAADPAASHLEMDDNIPGRDHEPGRSRHAPSVMAALAL